MTDYKGAALCVKKYRQIFRELGYEFRQEMEKHIGKLYEWDFSDRKPVIVAKGDGYTLEEDGVVMIFVEDDAE